MELKNLKFLNLKIFRFFDHIKFITKEIGYNLLQNYTMRSKTRLLEFFETFLSSFKKKFFFFQNRFSSSMFFLFSGFLFGNIFGTFLNAIRAFVNWDGFILLTLLFFIEIISYSTYHKEGRYFFFLWKSSSGVLNSVQTTKNQPLAEKALEKQDISFMKDIPSYLNPFYYQSSIVELSCKCLNFFKIGLMLGFFIDAFKVGS